VRPPPWQEGGAICDKGSCGGGGSPFGTRGCVWLESHKIGTTLFQFFLTEWLCSTFGSKNGVIPIFCLVSEICLEP
jgi:hypothetical protein